MFSTSSIINNIKKDESVEYKKLCKLLGISKKNDKEKLNIALNALEKLEIIKKNENNEYENVKDVNHIAAKIRCSSKGYCFAVRDNSNEDIYIKENLLNYAWNGDKVLVRIIKEGIRRRSPEGIVDCILERENKVLLAKVEVINGIAYGIPIDDRILAKIRLPDKDKEYIHKLDQKNIVKVEIDMFPIGQEEGLGHVIKELNLNNTVDNDNDFVLAKNNLNINQSKINLNINEAETTETLERLDLTSENAFMFKSWKNKNSPLLPIFSIDRLKDNKLQIWIHVNCLAEMIDFNNKNIFNYFENNYESFPLISKWRNYLDENLLNDSEFKVGEKNKAISLCLTLSKEKKIIDWSFHLTYVRCTSIIDNKFTEAIYKRKSKLTTKTLQPIENYLEQIKLILEVSKKFRSNQIKKGKYEIPKEENNIKILDEFYYHSPGDYYNDYLEPINPLDPQTFISPILFEADAIWFQHSLNYNIKNIFFNSNNLDYLNVNELAKNFQLNDNTIELDVDGNLSFDSLINHCKDENKIRIINKYLINNLRTNKALICENNDLERKYIFTHAPWTLPSKDYVNLANQYNLYLMFKYAKRGKFKADKKDIFKKDSWEQVNWNLFNNNILKLSNSVIDYSRVEKYNSFKSKSRSYISNIVSIKKIREAEKYVDKTFKGLIITVQSYGFFVELQELLVEGLVHVSTLNDDWYEYRSRQNLLIGRKSKNTFRVGDLIDIKINKVDILKYQIDLEIIN
tara:strand:- start:538 stop:2760 length:2223 start_codon:yes stop_codon:yes gene_type:complete